MDDASNVAAILEYNRRFVADAQGVPFEAGKKPKRQLAIVTCMDTRLIVLLLAALGLENGDANIIKVAGAEVRKAYGSVMRSLLVAVYELEVREIMVVAHTECGAQHMSCAGLSAQMKQAGIADEVFEAASAEGVDLDGWLEGFGDLESSVRRSVTLIESHPLMPSHIKVYGFVIETQTGELTAV